MANLEYYKQSNWVKNLRKENKIILIDCRGHGKSDKPGEATQYRKMVEDFLLLLDHLSIESANFFGYSMSAWLTLCFLLKYPKRVRSAILGGIGIHQNVKKIYEARINALSGKKVEDPDGLKFFESIKQLGYDLKLSLSIISGIYYEMGSAGLLDFEMAKDNLKKIEVPILTVLGSEDNALNKDLIAQLVPGACHFQIQGRNHPSTPEDPKFSMIIEAFLNHVNRICYK